MSTAARAGACGGVEDRASFGVGASNFDVIVVSAAKGFTTRDGDCAARFRGGGDAECSSGRDGTGVRDAAVIEYDRERGGGAMLERADAELTGGSCPYLADSPAGSKVDKGSCPRTPKSSV